MNITNDIIASYVDSFYEEEDEGFRQLRSFAEKRHIPIILRETEKILRILLALRKPRHILEIGTAIGYSASFFAKASRADIITIEKDPSFADAAENNIAQFGCSDRITVLRGSAEDILIDLPLHTEGKAGPFDFVFIDAAKTYYRLFWDLIIPMCSDGALVVCDNILMHGMTASDEFDPKDKHRTSIRSMREFLKYINDLEYADTSVISSGDGLSISRIDRAAYDAFYS